MNGLKIFITGVILFLQVPYCFSNNPNFLPNHGQWNGDFLARTKLSHGDFFLERNGFTVLFHDPEEFESFFGHNHDEEHQHKKIETFHHHSLKFNWIGANPTPQVNYPNPSETYYNFFTGSDQSNWKSNIHGQNTIELENIYPGINVFFHQKKTQIKYDYIIKPGGDPNRIKWKLEGTDEIKLSNNRVFIQTPLGGYEEWIPLAFQILNGDTVKVNCTYELSGNNFSFKLGKYDSSFPLIIDPTLVFSTFSGSLADNWGFTATYDSQGNFYGGGIAFWSGFPSTPGAYQTSYNAAPGATASDFISDITINKFNPDGTTLLYATYIGGTAHDFVMSMMVDQNDNLVLYGATGSPDYPVTANAVQDTFNGSTAFSFIRTMNLTQGADIVVSKLSANGSNLLASTFLGGTDVDGINLDIEYNYGDNTRGEVIVGDDQNIYIVSTTQSDDFPGLPSGSTINGNSDAIIVKLNPSLSSIIWATNFGGSDVETGFSLKKFGGHVFAAGGTKSSNLPLSGSGLNSTFKGVVDGYIVKLDATNGSIIRSTYLGETGYDQVFLIDMDKFGQVYACGQTEKNYPTTPNVYGNPGSRQFIHRIHNNLDQTLFSTTIGSGIAKYDLIPSAFNVDDCLRIYLSGWNGLSTAINYPAVGNTRNLPVTPDAFLSTTDGKDFYFMVLDSYASNLLYATFFGGTASEHVDGGTSRFSPDGVIYQGVCGGCGGQSFPTTPGVAGPNNLSSNCNFAGIKMNFDTDLESVAIVDTLNIDSACGSTRIFMKNLSRNANFFYWDLGNGNISYDPIPSINVTQLGMYQIKLIAEDTICDIADTAVLNINITSFKEPKASGSESHKMCDQSYEVNFKNTTNDFAQLIWKFGDGFTSKFNNPTHNYATFGTYYPRLVITDSCGQKDSVDFKVEFDPPDQKPNISLRADSCQAGKVIVNFPPYFDSNNFIYEWLLPGNSRSYSKYPDFTLIETGIVSLQLRIQDTLCNQIFEYTFEPNLEDVTKNVEIPNAFTPDGDGLNESLQIFSSGCVTKAKFQIFDAWGNVMFETENPFEEFWDGTYKGKLVTGDVFTYRFSSNLGIRYGYIVLIR